MCHGCRWAEIGVEDVAGVKALTGDFSETGNEEAGAEGEVYVAETYTDPAEAPDLAPEAVANANAAEPGDGADGPYGGGNAMGVVDTIPGDITTTATIAIGDMVYGSVSPVGDRDWFAVTLTAGETYRFSLNGVGPGQIEDTILYLYDSAGNLIASDDDSGAGYWSLLQYTAGASGAYYLGVGGYGDTETGDYSLTAVLWDTPTLLDAIDWQTRVTLDPGNVIQVYFAQAGETFNGQTSAAWTVEEQAQAMLALQQYSNVINVNFEVTLNSADAEFILVQNSATFALGTFNPPGYGEEGVGWFGNTGAGWNTAGLAQGGLGFVTLVHEFGHGLGLAHPHDSAAGLSVVMAGVTSAFNSYGSFDLNQGVYTTMSYNSGWHRAPHGQTPSYDYGFQGTPMALDIAVLQAKYGANTTHASGDNTYLLPGVNGAGTFYSAIWDTGGNDTIDASGVSANTVIDLRAATLEYETGGGGFMSYAAGIHGGFTIANGVVIENATGGSGNDILIGNEAANILSGGAGDDWIEGGLGADTLSGGDGAFDLVAYSQSDAAVAVNLATLTASGGHAEGDILSGFEDVGGSAFNDTITGDAFANFLDGAGGDDTLAGSGGNDALDGWTGNDNLDGGDGDDSLLGWDGNDTLAGGLGNDLLDGEAGNDSVNGNGGNDAVYGGAGDDTLQGGGGNDFISGDAGNDMLSGGNGVDAFEYDQRQFGADSIEDLLVGTDRIDLSGIGVSGLSSLAPLMTDTVNGVVISMFFNGVSESILVRNTTIAQLGAGSFIFNTTTVDQIVSGGSLGDVLFGQLGADTISGNNGDDILLGGAGNDTLSGGAGNDRLHGSEGSDILIGDAGNDALAGGSDADVFRYQFRQFGSDSIDDFQLGVDSIDLSALGVSDLASLLPLMTDTVNGVLISMALGGVVESILIRNATISQLTAGDFDFSPLTADRTVTGGSLADVLFGGAGADTINGQAGNDVLLGAAGNDTLNGGAGNDQVFGGEGDDIVRGAEGNDTLAGGAGNDTYEILGNDTIIENADEGFDTVIAGVDHTLGANLEALQLAGTGDIDGAGNEGNNRLIGNTGANTLTGLGGDDVISGGAGADTIDGGAGNDTIFGDESGDFFGLLRIGQSDFLGGSSVITFDTIGTVNPSYTVSVAGIGNVTVTSDGYFVGQASGSLNGTATLTLIDRTPLTGQPLALDAAAGNVFINTDGSVVTSPVLSGSPLFNGPIAILFSTPVAAVGLLGGFFDAINSTFIEAFDAQGNSLGVVTNNSTGQEFFGLATSNGEALIAGISFYITSTEPAGFAIDNLTFGSASSLALFQGGADILLGGDGDDWIDGGLGVDQISGGSGNDYLIGGAGADSLEGNDGVDTASYEGSNAGVTARLNGGAISGGHATGDTLSGIENLTGSDFNDTLIGANGVANRLIGGAGNDYIDGLSGNDMLEGGDGDDRLVGGAGADAMNGGAGVDTALYLTSGAAVTVRLNGGPISGGDAAGDTLVLVENIIGSAYGDTLIGADVVANRLEGGAGNDYLDGLSGDDVLLGGDGNDRIFGKDGVDFLEGGAGNDALDGGTGIDTASYAGSSGGVTVRLNAGDGAGGDAQGDTLTGIENLVGSALDDFLVGANGVGNRLEGNGGDDALYGLGGVDVLLGGEGNDRLEGGTGGDTLDGGNGSDTASYAQSSSAVTVRLNGGAISGGDAAGDTLISIENLTGSAYKDTLIGSGGENVLNGGGNNDYLDGQAGNDTLFGGSGDDRLAGGAGADTLDGGGGLDTALYHTSGAGVTVRLNVGTGTGGDAEGDTYASIENVTGSAFADTLIGANGISNRLEGGAGNDAIYGFGGGDTLAGGDGDDYLFGGLGNDYLDGGAGADVLVFDTALGGTNVDQIAGYSAADDTIRLENAVFTGLAAGVLGASAFTIGAAATTAAHRIIYNSSTGQLFFDADGSGAGAAILFATIDTGLGLTADDLFVV